MKIVAVIKELEVVSEIAQSFKILNIILNLDCYLNIFDNTKMIAMEMAWHIAYIDS